MGQRIAALLPILACVGLSCQLENKRSDESGVAVAVEEPVLEQVRLEHAGIPLDIWPAETEMMAGLDVGAIKDSPLGNVFQALIGAGSTGVLPTKTACQRKLVGAIDSMLFIQGFTGAMRKSVTVIRGIRRSQVEECVTASATEAAKKFGPSYGALDEDLEKYLVWWHDDETLLFSSDGGKKAIDLARPNKERPPTNAALLKSIGQVDTSAAAWIVAANTPSGMSESVAEFRGSIRIKDSLNASFRVQYDSAENASAAVKDTKKTFETLTPFAKYFEDSKVHAEGSLLMFDLHLSKSRVAEFAKDPMFQNMFPASQQF